MFKESALANLFLLLAPFAIGLLMAMLIPGIMSNPIGYAAAALSLYWLGFALFAAAKIQNIRKGYVVSFGSSRMSSFWKWAYRFGYTLMVIGFLFTTLLLVTRNLNP
jgi:hypothetical protein